MPKEVTFEEAFLQLVARQIREEEEGIDPGLSKAAQELLDAGIPIYYSDERYPGETVKEYPDGRREIVARDANHKQYVVRKL